MPALADNVKAFQALKSNLFQKDFLLTWEHSEEEIKAIHWAALLHDLGKIGGMSLDLYRVSFG